MRVCAQNKPDSPVTQTENSQENERVLSSAADLRMGEFDCVCIGFGGLFKTKKNYAFLLKHDHKR